jgi:uncharacterized protein (DUF2336 family)
MIVRQFLHWIRTASAGERADATSALARAYLFSDLSSDDRAAAEGAMLILLDDPSPLVRRALAEVFASSQKAPPAIVHALAGDQADIAVPVLERSPLLLDADLVDLVATGCSQVQVAIARRAPLPRAICAAIAEVGSAVSCLAMIENADADIAPFSLDRLVERHGHLPAVREILLARDDVAAPTRQALVAKLSETLAGFVAERAWLDEDRAQRIAREACERATVALAVESPVTEVRPLIRHLRQSGQLTAGLILRALLCGGVVLFEEALAELSELSLTRVSALLYDRRGAGLRALFETAGLPVSAYPAFREALAAMQEVGFVGGPKDLARLKRRMTERVLTRCEQDAPGGIEPLLTLLRRFATEAARAEARMFCEDLVAGNRLTARAEEQLAAA